MIFLDANYLISLFIETEEEHETALKIWDKIENEQLIISNSIILEVMTISNIKIKISKEKLEEMYYRLNNSGFGIIEDISFIDNGMKRMINYLPQRVPLFDTLYIELIKQLEITHIVTFDKHFKNKGIEVIGE